MKRNVIKIIGCFLSIGLVVAVSIIPCFASSTDNVVGHPVTLANPFTMHFCSYERTNNQLIYQSFTESCAYQQRNVDYPFVDDARLFFDVGEEPLIIDRNFGISGNTVSGNVYVSSEEDFDSPWCHMFSGVSFIQPFFIESNKDPNFYGGFDLVDVNFEDVNFALYRYELFNFETLTFDTFTDVLPLNSGYNLFIPSDIFYSIQNDQYYSKNGITVMGSLDISPTYDVTGSNVSAVKFMEINFTPSRTYTSLGNRNDEYFQRVIRAIVDEGVVIEKEYVYVTGTDWTTWLVTSVRSFLNAPLFGSANFTIGGLLSIVIGLAVFLIFLKIFAGG